MFGSPSVSTISDQQQQQQQQQENNRVNLDMLERGADDQGRVDFEYITYPNLKYKNKDTTYDSSKLERNGLTYYFHLF